MKPSGELFFGTEAIQKTWGVRKGSNEEGTRQGRAHPPGSAPHPRGPLVAPPTSSPSILVVFWSKKNNREGFIPFGLCLVFLFCETLK